MHQSFSSPMFNENSIDLPLSTQEEHTVPQCAHPQKGYRNPRFFKAQKNVNKAHHEEFLRSFDGCLQRNPDRKDAWNENLSVLSAKSSRKQPNLLNNIHLFSIHELCFFGRKTNYAQPTACEEDIYGDHLYGPSNKTLPNHNQNPPDLFYINILTS